METENGNSSLFRTIIDNIDDGVYFVDYNRSITLWNKAACRITGYAEEDMIGRHCYDNLLNHVDESGKPLCIVGCPLYDTINDGKERTADVLLRHKSGHRLPVQVQTHPIYQGGEIVGALEIFTQRVPTRYDDRLVTSLTDRAMKDSLTGLPNRAYLESYIEYKLSEARRYQMPFSVLLADVDNLADFNHYYGSPVGDVMLQSMAESFRGNFMDPDKVGVWRNGQFVGVFDYVDSNAVYAVVEKMRVLASQSAVYYQEGYLALSVSVGLTIARPRDTVQSLVARAEALMDMSRQRGQNCCTVDVEPV